MQDVVVINKKELGKMIRDYSGNESAEKNEGLRKLLQTCIDFIQTESKAEAFWENASITIYDQEDNMYKITSGTRRHQFICRMKNGEPFIMEKKVVSQYTKKHKETRRPRNMYEYQCALL